MATENEQRKLELQKKARKLELEAKARQLQATALTSTQEQSGLSSPMNDPAMLVTRPGTNLTERQAMVQDETNRRRVAEEQYVSEKQRFDEGEARAKRKKDWKLAGKIGPKASFALFASELIPTLERAAVRAGPVGVGAGMGQTFGQRLAGKPGKVVGGAIGAAAGDAFSQAATNPDGRIGLGSVIGAAMEGGITSRGAVANAAANVASETVRSLVDDQRFPSLSNIGVSATLGGGSAAISNSMSPQKLVDDLYDTRKATFRDLRGEGVVVNPQELKRGGVLPAIAGSSQTTLSAVERNAPVFQRLAREEIGLPSSIKGFRPDKRNTITGALERPGEIREALTEAKRPYDEIRGISAEVNKMSANFQAGKPVPNKFSSMAPADVSNLSALGDTLDDLKIARDEVKKAYAAMKLNDPEAFKMLEAAKKNEDLIELKIEAAATAWGDKSLLNRLKDARLKMAKIFAVRDAVSDAQGIIDVSVLDSMRATDKKPGRFLTGNLEKMAKFNNAYSDQSQNAITAAIKQPSAAAGANYIGREMAQGRPGGYIGAMLPWFGNRAEDILLSDLMQNRILKPEYVRLPEELAGALVRQGGAAAGRDTGQ